MAGREASLLRMKNKLQENTLRHRAVNGVVWLSGTKAVGQGVSWIITIYIARILSPADYGLMGMAMVLIAFMQLFNEMGLGSAIIQKKDLTEDDLVTLHWTVSGLNSSFYLIAFSLAPTVALFFHEPRITPMIRVIGLNFFINSVGFVSYNLLNKSMDFRNRSVSDFVASLAGSVSTLFFAVKGMGVWSLVLGGIMLEVTRNTLLQMFSPWVPRFFYSYESLKKFSRFGSQIVASRILWYLYSNSDKLIAGKMLGTSILGYYSLAMQFAMMPLDKIITLVNQIALPAFSQIQHDSELTRKYFLKVVRYMACFTFPLFFGIILVADEAVKVLLTDKWSSIVIPLKILCLVAVLRAINAIYTPVFLARGKTQEPLMNNLLLAFLMPVGFYIGSFHGLIGFSISWIIVFPIPFMIITAKMLRLLNIHLLEFVNGIKHFLIGSLFMASVVLGVRETLLNASSDVIKLLGSCSAGLMSYCLYQVICNRNIISESRALLNRG